MVIGNATIEQKREIAELVERLYKGLGVLTSNQDKLVSRLCPVLRSTNPIAATPADDHAPLTQLGDTLRKLALTAEERNAIVLDILDRLEL